MKWLRDPNTLISDAAKRVQNAFRALFRKDVLIIMFWADMKKNVRKKVELLILKQELQEITADIDYLQLS